MDNPTLLDYVFLPSEVFITTETNIKLVVTNPISASPLQFEGGRDGDEIDITFPVGSGKTDLTNSLGFTATCIPTSFSCAKANDSDNYVIRSGGGATLNPGEQIQVTFNNVIINSLDGTASMTIEEYIGTHTGSGSTSISKIVQELNIIAWAEPLVIGLNQLSTLYWQSMMGTRVEVAGFPDGTGTKTFPCVGDPPYPGNCPIGILASESQRTYTLTVYTGDNKHVSTRVTITQVPPIITSYISDKSGTLGVNDSVKLTWSYLFAASTALKPPGPVINNPISPRTVVPGQDLLKAYEGSYPAMPNQATYTFMAFGYQKNASQTLSFKLAPVGLAYFKYMVKGPDGKLSGVKWQTDPADWKAIDVLLNNDLNVLTIWQPGGYSDKYYLGSGDTVHPQIQYFNCEAATGGQYTLSWVTANLTSLVLNPGNYTIPSGDILDGSKTLSLTANKYILTGVGTNGQTITSILTVPYSNLKSSTMEAENKHEQAEDIAKGELFNDPNCTITITQGGPINNYYNPSPANRRDATDAIAQLTFADIWRLPPFRITSGTVRLDVQGAIPGGGRNWQVQVNGVQGHSTISAITVQGNLATASTAERRAYVERMVRGALVNSLNTGNSQDVNGPCR